MKIIREPDLAGEHVLTPAEMNKIHFGGNRTPLTPEQLAKLANEQNSQQTNRIRNNDPAE